MGQKKEERVWKKKKTKEAKNNPQLISYSNLFFVLMNGEFLLNSSNKLIYNCVFLKYSRRNSVHSVHLPESTIPWKLGITAKLQKRELSSIYLLIRTPKPNRTFISRKHVSSVDAVNLLPEANKKFGEVQELCHKRKAFEPRQWTCAFVSRQIRYFLHNWGFCFWHVVFQRKTLDKDLLRW